MRWPRYAGCCRRSKDELISGVHLWTPSHGRASVGRIRRIYLQQLCSNTFCSLEELPGVMDDRDIWREKESQGNPC